MRTEDTRAYDDTDRPSADRELVRIIRGALLMMEAETAATRMMLALRALERKYDPNQPRVPKGSADGGQWTDVGRSGERTDPADDYRLVEPGLPVAPTGEARVVLINRGGGRRRLPPTVVVNGRRVPVTPAQALQLDLLHAEAVRVVRDARAIQPGWRPRPGLYEGAEGLIAHRRAEIAEARLFVALRGGGQRPVQESLADVLAASGRRLGEHGTSNLTRIVPRFEMLPALGRLTAGAREIPAPRG